MEFIGTRSHRKISDYALCIRGSLFFYDRSSCPGLLSYRSSNEAAFQQLTITVVSRSNVKVLDGNHQHVPRFDTPRQWFSFLTADKRVAVALESRECASIPRGYRNPHPRAISNAAGCSGHYILCTVHIRAHIHALAGAAKCASTYRYTWYAACTYVTRRVCVGREDLATGLPPGGLHKSETQVQA